MWKDVILLKDNGLKLLFNYNMQLFIFYIIIICIFIIERSIKKDLGIAYKVITTIIYRKLVFIKGTSFDWSESTPKNRLQWF